MKLFTKAITLFLTMCFSGATVSEDKFPETELDRALIDARGENSIDRSFYNTLLRTTLYMPTYKTPDEERNYRAKAGTTIAPILIESGDVKYLMLFDTPQRLGNWAGREVGYSALPGHAIAEMMDTSTYWYLNDGTGYGKEFTPDEIVWIKSNLEALKTHTTTLKGGEPILIGKPKVIPKGIIETLVGISKRNNEVVSVAFGQIFIKGVTKEPSLSIAIKTDPVDESVLEAIENDFIIAAQGHIPEGADFLIFVAGESETAQSIFEAVGPIYDR
jgi:hypothetical protein